MVLSEDDEFVGLAGVVQLELRALNVITSELMLSDERVRSRRL